MASTDFRAEWFSKQITWLPYNPVLGTREVCDVDPPEKEMLIEEWRSLIGANFAEYKWAAEVCLSVLTQLLVQDVRNPFPLMLIDRASTGKTIVINFFSGIEGVTHTLDQFTPAAFVSHIAGRTKQQLEKIDLLPLIRYKTLLTREMGTLFSENDDALRQKLGMLTRIFDGEGFTSHSGVHGGRGYEGDYLFMFIGASTPFPLRVWKLMTELGHRIHFLNLRTADPTEDELIAQTQGENYKIRETRCKQATGLMVRSLWTKWKDGVSWDKTKNEPEILRWIARIARFVARFRGDIVVYDTWGEMGREVASTAPKIENPSRLNSCFTNLAMGHAIACGRNYLTMDDLGVVLHVAISTSPSPRPELLLGLLRNAGTLSIDQVCSVLSLSAKQAKKEMYKFLKTGVCVGEIGKEEEETDDGAMISYGQPKRFISIHHDFSWWTGEEMVSLLDKFGIIR